MNYFAINTKLLRKKKGLTQAQVSEALKLGEKSLSNYENGRREPGFDDLVAFADYFGVSTDYLLKENADTTRYIEEMKHMADEYLGKSIAEVVEKSGLWKKYVDTIKEDEETTYEGCDYNQTCMINDCSLEEQYKSALDAFESGNLLDAQTKYEKLLTDGDYDVLKPLLNISERLNKIDMFGEEIDLLRLETELEYIEKVIIYGTIAYKEATRNLENLYKYYGIS